MGVKRAFDFGLKRRLNAPKSNREGVFEMPDPDKPTRERAALQRLLRRRGRRGKVGANPETETKIHAWHSSYSFRPGSSHSGSGIVWTVIGLLAALSAPVWITVLWAAVDHYEDPHATGAAILQTIVVGCMLLIIATILIAPVLMIALSLGGAWESRRERRGKAAEASGEET